MRLVYLSLLLSSIHYLGCSSAEKKSNAPFNPTVYLDQEFRSITLEHAARVSVTLTAKNPTFISCFEHVKNVKVELYSGVNSFADMHTVTFDCPYRSGMIHGRTRSELPPGKYRIRYRPSQAGLFTMASAKVALNDKSFASGSNQVIEGATPLDKDSRINESIDAKNGDPYDWIEVKGRTGKIKVTFINDPGNAKLVATLYKQGVGGKLNRISSLNHKESKEYNLGGDPLFFKVEGVFGKYTLIRSDIVEPTQLQVLDIYRITGKQWNVALSHKGEVKDGHEVLIKGQNIESRSVQNIARCTVTKVEAHVAFCVFERDSDLSHRDYQGEVL